MTEKEKKEMRKAAQELGRVGARRRAEVLLPERRSEIASLASKEDISERLSLAPFFHPPTVTENSWTLGMSGFSSKEEALEDCYRRFRGYAYEARHDPRVKIAIGRMILEELSKLTTLRLANVLQSNGYFNGDEWLRNLKIKE